MKTYDGLAPLIDQYSDREAEGWILLKSRDRLDNAASLADATFIVADDEEEEDELLDTHANFLEIPTFRAVIATEREASRTSVDDIAAASLHYLEQDSFRD